MRASQVSIHILTSNYSKYDDNYRSYSYDMYSDSDSSGRRLFGGFGDILSSAEDQSRLYDVTFEVRVASAIEGAAAIVQGLPTALVNAAEAYLGRTPAHIGSVTYIRRVTAPPPPAAPPPAEPPGMLCDDSCERAFNGHCEDIEAKRLEDKSSGSDLSVTGELESQLNVMSNINIGSMMTGDPNGILDGTAKPGSCSLGSDCFDCSVARSLCTTCEPACRARGFRMGARPQSGNGEGEWCLDTMFGDGVCDPACNNAECGHDNDDCSLQEALEVCVLATPHLASECECLSRLSIVLTCGERAPQVCEPLHANRYLKSKPANVSSSTYVTGSNRSADNVPIEARLTTLNPFLVSLDTTTNKWTIAIDFTLQLRWRDSRFHMLPCRRLLPDQLHVHVSKDAYISVRYSKEENKSLLWFPSMTLESHPLDYTTRTNERFAIRSASFAFTSGETGEDETAWSGVAPPDGGATCYDCAPPLACPRRARARACAFLPSCV